MKMEISYRTRVWHPQSKVLNTLLLLARLPFILLAAMAVSLSYFFLTLAIGKLAAISMLADFFSAKADEMHFEEMTKNELPKDRPNGTHHI
jgi:ABC-type methionine transport system permease subunit